MRKHGLNGYPSFSTHNQGFFTRHMRRISSSLPRFNSGLGIYQEKDKPVRNQWPGQDIPILGRLIRLISTIYGRMGRGVKRGLVFAIILTLCVIVFYTTREFFLDLSYSFLERLWD